MIMKKKKILFINGSMEAGGAEKSLASILSLIPCESYDIDLMLSKCEGLFMPLIPDYVNIIEAPVDFRRLNVSVRDFLFYFRTGAVYLLKKIIRYRRAKKDAELSFIQSLWSQWRKDIGPLKKEYDCVLAYQEGFPNYYAIDKVKAQKKILWIHNTYSKLGYNSSFDSSYFEKSDAVVTISELCRLDLINHFPDLINKIKVLENISNPEMIIKMSMNKVDCKMFNECLSPKLLSIGRLTEQKNFALAIDTAKRLKDKGVDFQWFIIGEGGLRNVLLKKCQDLNVEDCFHFIGLQSNPYYFMRKADLIVMTSLYEGKSIAIDEAKILCKPIVATNYTSVYDALVDNETGVISEMNPESLSVAILRLLENKKLRETLMMNLSQNHYNNLSEANKYIEIIER